MKKKRVLYISQEITPYLPESEMSLIGRFLPQGIQERGREIRTFMPRFGSINERRHQLHEVIRLSGMNLIINDADHPLIIKVASIQSARMQIYFIDNDDFFQRKSVFGDEKQPQFDDNDERAIFFARGVLETVKKLRWAPDLIHCHGWFTSVIPLYMKRVFYDDPLFNRAKVVFSLYNDVFETSLNHRIQEKILLPGIKPDDVSVLAEPDHFHLMQLAINHSDALIMGSNEVPSQVAEFARATGKPLLEFQNGDAYVEAYSQFYKDHLGV